MSTPNYSQPTTPAPYGSGNSGNNDGQKRLLTIAGIAIALLLGTTIFLAISKYKTGQQLSNLEMNYEQQTAALNEVQTQFNNTIAELEQQKGINQELDTKINEQISELSNQKSQIDQLIREKKDYRGQLNKMQEQSRQYLAEIEQLKQQVGILTDQNTQLNTENQQLNTNLTETRTQLDQTSQANAQLISAKTQLETQNTVLSKKADVGSAIKVMPGTIEVKPVSVSSSGKEKTKNKAKKVDKVNICFTTEANEVTDAGEEVFNIIILDPTGAPLLNDALGSGVSKDKRSESEFRYTTNATCNYSNQETKVCGGWQPGQQYVPGKYTVEIYNKGYKVGSTTFNLKKGLF